MENELSQSNLVVGGACAIYIYILVEYHMRCCGFSYDLRKTTQKEGKQYDNAIHDKFCSYNKSNKSELWLKTTNV
jgi:hypothetical protein